MVSRPRLLDLFCGAGGCSVGYNRAGFEVVGVDLEEQPSYPFEFVQADALATLGHLLNGGRVRVMPLDDESPRYGLADFDAIHASPPCQAYTTAKHIHRSERVHPQLVAPTRELLERSGKPWVMENVVGSPLEAGPAFLCGLMFGLKVLRHRLFETSFLLMTPPHPQHPKGNLTNSKNGYSTGSHGFVCVAGHNFVRAAGAKAMGIDWMTRRCELANAIPPAYTEFIGKQLLSRLGDAE